MTISKQVPLKVERKDQDSSSGYAGGGLVACTPDLDEDYWSYRVIVGEHQAIVGFPKLGMIGVGFAVEDTDWNRNLPHSTQRDLWNHIKCNKGDDSIPDELCIEAIRLIDQAVRADKACDCRRCK
jgi:hypothetical protein